MEDAEAQKEAAVAEAAQERAKADAAERAAAEARNELQTYVRGSESLTPYLCDLIDQVFLQL